MTKFITQFLTSTSSFAEGGGGHTHGAGGETEHLWPVLAVFVVLVVVGLGFNFLSKKKK